MASAVFMLRAPIESKGGDRGKLARDRLASQRSNFAARTPAWEFSANRLAEKMNNAGQRYRAATMALKSPSA